MPFNGSGTFSIINVFVPNTTILSSAVNQNFSDIATGLSDCLTRDGQAGMTAVFKAVSGSVSAPGISFTSDTTAGLFLSSTGIPGFVAKSLGILLNSAVYQVSAAAIQAGGSGYAIGDTITLTGGTAIVQAVLTVATLSGSAVATVTVTYPGNYTTKPADPVSQGSTSGAGTGATFNMTWTTQFTRSVVTDEASAPVWERLGSSSFVSGLMAKANGLDFATGIGGSNIAAVLGSSFIIPPGGVLTPVSSTTVPIPSSDQTAVTRIYWTPLVGNNCPIYNGVNMVQRTTAQIFCDLTAGAQVLNGIYDVYMFLNAGTPTLGFSPTWSAGTSGSVTAGSCARGTGAGGTALSVISGVLVNTVSQTVNNGATTYTMAANQGTYLGSVYINAVAGQYNCFRAYGQNRVWGLWNAYNKRPIILTAGDSSTGPWSATATWRQSNGATGNKITTFTGLAVDEIDATFTQRIASIVPGSSTQDVEIAIGFNSTTSSAGSTQGFLQFGNAAAAILTPSVTVTAAATYAPNIGINNVNAIEQAGSGAAASNLFGSQSFMNLRTNYPG